MAAAQTKPRVDTVHILWITAGLSCDGDTISVTAASQPSIEDVLLGAVPGLPKVQLHNPVLAYELGGDSFGQVVSARDPRMCDAHVGSKVTSHDQIVARGKTTP